MMNNKKIQQDIGKNLIAANSIGDQHHPHHHPNQNQQQQQQSKTLAKSSKTKSIQESANNAIVRIDKLIDKRCMYFSL